ncbi:MAG: 1-deoxy-D-xylulose-5-phosphate reductoisomerase [candidate division NC10 bacterium]|nr:1-deoxy-D-xylulose-5-phosphate reductoisomerase [candidate division NC10 bacterium]
MKRVSILGSTGSIGVRTLDVIERHPDGFQVVALAAGTKVDLLAEQVLRFRPHLVSVATEEAAKELQRRLPRVPVNILWGEEGLVQVARTEEADLVVSALVGSTGLLPTLAAIRAGKDIALANKEVLVMAGELVTAEARKMGVKILPVDSEHSAIFQCLGHGGRQYLKKIILTASGGPFRTRPKASFASVTPEEALNHPTWNMGRKITIDSATLMNKGLEVIEARWLFDLSLKEIDIIIHPQSIIHSLVEYMDGSILAQLSVTDMRLPILYALSYPKRLESPLPSLDLTTLAALTFEPLDMEKFPCIGYAYEAAEAGGTLPTVLNAANEVAVHLFLERRLGFDEIPLLIRKAMDEHGRRPVRSLEDVLEADREVRQRFTMEYSKQ